jgi:AsmA protein
MGDTDRAQASAPANRRRRWPWVLGGIGLLLLVAVAGALAYLDSLLLKRARAEVEALSQQWGRPVTLADISTQLFPRLGVQVEGVEIGAGEGEPEPLATLSRAEVGVMVMPALRSRGKDIQVTQAVVTGLNVNVIRLPDGSQNVSRLLERIQAGAADEKPEPTSPEPPRDLSAIRVDRAALTDARVRFIDLAAASRRELAISDLDVEVKDLRAGQPLEVTLKAAVFAAAQNLDVRLQAAPLPPTLVPVPERLALKADAIDLAPLGPFLGRSVGLEKGTLDADWSAELGGAVPGGSGPTRLSGTVKVDGLRFAGAEVSRALDVVVDTDVKGDVAAGDLSLDRLRVEAGPLRVHGKGRVKGLMSETPAVEGLEILIPSLDPAALAEYVPALRRALAGRAAGPASIAIRGSGTAAAQAIRLEADLTPMRLAVPEELTKAAGAPLTVSAVLSGSASGKRALRFQVDADLGGVDLRPGDIVNKAPGQAMTVAARGTSASRGGATQVEVDSLAVRLLDQRLSGTAGLELKGDVTAFRAALESPRLDLDQLLHEAPAPATPAPTPAPPRVKDPHRFDGLRGDVQLKVAALRVEKVDLQDVVLDLKMVDDAITLQRLTCGLYGGQVVADGTSIKLGPAQRPFTATVQLRDVDVARLIASRSDRKILSGKLSADVAVQGVGTRMSGLSQTLAGTVGGNLQDGRLLGADIFAGATAILARALPFAARGLEGQGITDLGDTLPFSVTVEQGIARLKRPISITRPLAALSVDGGVRLDGTLEMAGTLSLPPEAVAKISGGKVTPKESIPVPIQITGPAWKPDVSVVDLQTPVKVIARYAAAEVAGRALGEKGKQVADILTGGEERLKEEAAARQKELEARAAEEAAKAEALARQKAEEARRRLEEEARKRLEEEAKKRLKGLFGQ